MSELQTRAAALPGYEPQSLRLELAQDFISGLLAPLPGTETLPLRQALGRVLAAELISPIDVPAADNSAMDGYALRGADLAAEGPTRLRVAGRSLAGEAPAAPLAAGECRRIMTGALIPPGADTVVPQELVQLQALPGGDSELLIPPGCLRPGAHRRRAGEDLARGQSALAAGQRLRPAELGLLASLGLAEVTVRQRPRVALLSTGDELQPPGAPLPPGGVYDSNRHTLWALLQGLPVEVLDLGSVRDDPALLRQRFAEAAAAADLVISTGGVGVGEADHTKRVMAELGDVLFWQLALRPGRPLALGRLGPRGSLLLGLPGNPVAVMVGFYAFVRPALLALAGSRESPWPPALRARSAQMLRKRPGRSEFQRGVVEAGVDGQLWVRSTGNQGSGVLSSMSRANGLIRLGHEQGDVAQGDWVEVLPFEGLHG